MILTDVDLVLRIVRDIGAASTVLLKNVNKALPLKKPRRIAIIGMFLSYPGLDNI